MLVALGRYTDCNLDLPGLRVSLMYSPGTVVGLSGMMLEHAVPSHQKNYMSFFKHFGDFISAKRIISPKSSKALGYFLSQVDLLRKSHFSFLSVNVLY
jgi:hypothetical protein